MKALIPAVTPGLEGRLFDAASGREVSAVALPPPVNIKIPNILVPKEESRHVPFERWEALLRASGKVPAEANAYVAGLPCPSDERFNVYVPVVFYKIG